ncbi:reverse transcriptase domain-containing protein [Tanacetum coccineum]
MIQLVSLILIGFFCCYNISYPASAFYNSTLGFQLSEGVLCLGEKGDGDKQGLSAKDQNEMLNIKESLLGDDLGFGVKNDSIGNKLKKNVVFDPVVSCYSGSFEHPTQSRLKNTIDGEPEGYVDIELGANRQNDGKHCPPSFASFLREESSRRKVNFCTLETEQTDLADVLIPKSSVLKKYGVKRVMGDKNGFIFIQFSSATGLEGVLEHEPWWIRNALFFLRMWNPSSKLSKVELTYVHVWNKFHGVPASAFTADGLSAIATHLSSLVMLDSCIVTTCVQSWGRMDYARTLVDIRVDRALKDTMWKKKLAACWSLVSLLLKILVQPNIPEMQKNLWRPSGNRVPKSAYQKKTYSTLVSNSLSAFGEDNETPMDDLVDGTKKKSRAPPRKTGIWSGRKGEYYFTSPNPFDLFTKDDGKGMLRDLQESDDDPDEKDGYDETKKNEKYVTKNNSKMEQLSKYEADYEKDDDDDDVEVAMVKLHYAHEALEREVHELELVWKDDPLFSDDSIDESSNILKPQTTINNQSAFVLEDLKTEVDEMIKLKVNLEVQYIAISSQHMETMNRLEIAERKAIELRKQYDKLKMTCDKILDSEDGCNVRNSLCKSTSMFGIQLILLGLVLYLVVQKIFSHGGMEDELATT